VFMSEVAVALRENNQADLSFAYPSFLLATSHISTDVLAFVLKEQPMLLMLLGIAGFGYFMFTDEATRATHLQSINWSNVPPNVRVQLIDGLVAYYKHRFQSCR